MDWKKLFKPSILQEGLAYYQNDAVEDYESDNNYIQAIVQGEWEYNVCIDIADGIIYDMECDCSYAEKGNYCKHMAAVLYCMPGEAAADISSFQAKKNGNAAKDNHSKEGILALIETTDEGIVKGFLADILYQDEKLYNRFKSSVCHEVSPADMKRYKKQINQIFSKYVSGYNYVDYHNMDSFLSELEDFLNLDVQWMLQNQQYEQALELTNYIFSKTSKQDMDDSDGEMGVLGDTCQDIWQRILDHCDQKLEKQMFQWYMQQLDGSAIDYMKEYIETFLFENFKEEAYLEEKRKFADKMVHKDRKQEDAWSSSYHGGRWAITCIEILKEQKQSQDQINNYCKDHIGYNVVRDYYLSECIKNKDTEEAIRILKEGIEKAGSSLGYERIYSEQLKDLYKQLDKREDYEQELWSLLLQYDKGDLGIYKELKALYTNEEWMVKREIVFQELSDSTAIEKLYKEENMYDKLLKSVLKSAGLYKLSEYEDCLKDIYPEELLGRYEEVVTKRAVQTSNRSTYQELVAILRRMLNYPGGKEKVDAISDSWKSLYKNRPAMIDELNSL